MAAPVLAALLPGFISGIVDAFRPALKAWFPDPEQQAKAELQLKQLAQKASLTEFQGVVDIITAEAKSEHWLTSTWRPITALTFVAIVANNYILYPYLSLFWVAAPKLELPPEMWSLLQIMIGGYVVGRSAERFAEKWKKGD